ncbi:MAG: peptidoglycan bridge formation glycyltransferase FemA/FemB family protein [Chloroflexota bacterium]
MTLRIHEASAAELADWDAHVVDEPQGNVHQSRAWAAYREAFGWQPRFLVADDGARILALSRAWPLVRSEGVYLSRGPLPAPDAGTTLARLEAVAAWFAARGAAVVASDSEVPAESGYPELLAAAGYHRIEELQPSRHRLAVELAGVAGPDELLARFSATTRNMIRAAERSDMRIVRYGPLVPGAAGTSSPDADPAGGQRWPEDPTAELLAELDALYGSMRATAERRGFGLASRPRFLDWSRRAFVDGHLVYLGAHDLAGELVAGATFYRHGRRWTYSHAADDPRFRKAYPGAVRLVVWEAIKAAHAEGRDEMDLGGVDVSGARRRPEPGEPTHGMLTFKESFGARWIELSGAHERVFSRTRYAIGRLAARIGAAAGH